MAFDPDSFIAGTQEQAPEVAEPTDKKNKFNPSEFIRKTPDYVPTLEPTMVAETEVPIKEATLGDVATMAAQAAAPLGLPVESTGVMRPSSIGPVQPTVGYQLAPTGYNAQAVKDTLAPFKQAIPQTLAQYKGPAGGYKAFADLAVPTFTGGLVPPPTASIEALKTLPKVYEAGQQSMGVLGEKLSRPDFGPYKQGGAFPEAVSAYRDLRATAGKIDPAFSAQMKTALDTGGDRAVKKLLANAPDALKASPEFMAQANRFTQAMPSTMQQMGRVLGPVARGAARVAGPVGMGMSLYDAGQMTRETNLGSRLGQGQGQRAEQAFRNMNTQYGGPISPQEEQNVMASGSERDIQALIRRKAAQRVLGPVAPQ